MPLTCAAESNRLLLQLLNVEDHLDDYHEILSNPEAMSWSTKGVHTSLQETELDMLQRMPIPGMEERKTYAIFLRPENQDLAENQSIKPKMIGVVGTKRLMEIAYKLHPSYWGKGYMSEALTMFLTLLWGREENQGYMHITAFADPENIASTRVLEKAGFKKGKLIRSQYERAVNHGSGKRSDLQGFWLQRPVNTRLKLDESVETDNEEQTGLSGCHSRVDDEVSHDELRNSIREMLG